MSLERRSFLHLSALASAAPLIGACSGNTTSSAALPQTNIDLTGLDWKEAFRAAARPYRGETVHVRAAGGQHDEIARQAASEFAQLTGIKVSWGSSPIPKLFTEVILDMTTRAGDIDVIPINYPWLGSFVSKGGLQPLRPYLEASSLPALSMDTFVSNLIRPYGVWNGELYGVPYLGDAMIFVYNKRHFEKAGLDPDSPPQTWGEVVDFGKRLTGDGQYGYALMGGRQSQATSQYSAVLYALGKDFYDATGRPQFSTHEGIEAMRITAKGLASISPPAAKTWGLDRANQAVVEGLCSMQLQWPGALAPFTNPDSQTGGDMGFAPPPGGKGPLGGWGLGVNAASKNKVASWLLVNYLVSLPIQRKYQSQGYAVTAKTLFEDPAVDPQKLPWVQEVGTSLSTGAAWPRTPETQQVLALVARWVNTAVAGQASPEQAARKLNAEVTRTRDKFGMIDT